MFIIIQPATVRVLQLLVKNDSGHAIDHAVSRLQPLLPELTETQIASAIVQLNELGKIVALAAAEGMTVLVRPEGHFFIKQWEEIEAKRLCLKRQERFTDLYAFFSGVLFALILAWFKVKFFP